METKKVAKEYLQKDILRQPPTVIESSLMKMRSMAVMCIK